jgi:hypothetical protein
LLLSVAVVVIFCAYFCFFLQDTRALAGRIVQHLLKTLDRIRDGNGSDSGRVEQLPARQ